MKRNDILDKVTEIKQWVKEHRSKAFICKQLQCKPATLDSYLQKMGIVYKGNQGGKGRKSAQIKPAVSYLYKGSTISTNELKLKLIRDGLKAAECESCYLRTWFNNPVPLHLHHINGDRFDNRFENLQILCPNCHALTDNYAGKSKKKIAPVLNNKDYAQIISEGEFHNQPVSVLIFDSPESYAHWQELNPGLQRLISKGRTNIDPPVRHKICLYCGKSLTSHYQDTYCSQTCCSLAKRKIARPSQEELHKLIWEKPTIHIAKDFGVSDKAIEKWCKAYKIEKPPRGYWAKKRHTKI